jgi:hypothetical protein
MGERHDGKSPGLTSSAASAGESACVESWSRMTSRSAYIARVNRVVDHIDGHLDADLDLRIRRWPSR